MLRSRLLVLVLVLLAVVAARCSSGGGTIISPGSVVSTFDFTIDVAAPEGFTLDEILLNDVPIPVPAGSAAFATLIQPGPPLRDHNTLVVRSVNAEGQVRVTDRGFEYLPPKARVHRIESADDLIRGPLAHSRIGDFLLANTVARFVVQDVAQRDLYSVGQFGGNLIDAELVGREGRDQFLEVQPMLNLETVINAQTVEIVNDGQDGTPAILRTCGPDDLLDFVNPSSAIVDAGFPAPTGIDDLDFPIEACTEYILAPGDPWVRMDTTVFNLDTQPVNLAVGDWLNAAGQLEQWNRPFLPGEVVLGDTDLISFIGYGEAEGIDYGFQIIPDPSGAGAPTNSATISGVGIVLYNANAIATLFNSPPPFVVAAGGEATYTRYFAVGDGSGANSAAMAAATTQQATARLEGCVTVGGQPAAGARVSLVQLGINGPFAMDAQFVTRAGPCPNYGADLPVGTYHAAADRPGSLYPGGAPTPSYLPVSLASGGVVTVQDFALPAPARLEVQVSNGSGEGIPARISVVGFDPSPPQIVAGPAFPGFGSSTLGVFADPKDRLPFGLVAFEYADANGFMGMDVEPGTYQIVTTRGTEYSDDRQTVTLTAGATTALGATLERVIDTTGFVSSDFHVHGIHSPDSRVPHERRVRQFAGEGVDNVVMTDHHVHTDLRPTIQELGYHGQLTATVGEEITTFDYGHFNGYPFTIDPTVPSGGSTDWAQAAPPGMDFPSFGAFNATPPEIHDLAVNGPRATPATTVQVNHIDSHFTPLRIDTSVAGPVTDGLDDAARANRRLPPVAASGNLFHPFAALELWNGASAGAQREFTDGRIGVWMNLLNKGYPTTVIADTDTHTFTNLRTAGARTWTASSTDRIDLVSSDEVGRSVTQGRAVGGQGIYPQVRLVARDGSEASADLTLGGSTLVQSTDGSVDLEIRLQAPDWAEFDTIEIYANAPTTPVDPAAPYAFTATPDLVLMEGDCDAGTVGDGDFDIQVVPAAGTARTRQEVNLVVPYRGLTQDTWFVVLVRGSAGLCEPMFPVYPSSLSPSANATLADLLDGNLGEGGVRAMGVTNALYADVDGVPGFHPPNP